MAPGFEGDVIKPRSFGRLLGGDHALKRGRHCLRRRVAGVDVR